MSERARPLTEPVQPRARQSYEALLDAAQCILEESGYEALNSNAVAARAGMTPPTFYRYFADKQMLLAILAQRLLDAQNALVPLHLDAGKASFTGGVDAIEALMTADIELTRAFKASFELMVLLRSLPELRQLRIAAHQQMSGALARELAATYPEIAPTTLRARLRLGTEVYYSTMEMLFETGFKQQREIVRRAAVAIQALVILPDP
ncbi:MAG: TetR/AcrR family transcriptional regulator [Pseudomonadota bacterium]